MIDNLTERQRQLLAEHERRNVTAGPGKLFSRTFLDLDARRRASELIRSSP